jgi:hypothetical protein
VPAYDPIGVPQFRYCSGEITGETLLGASLQAGRDRNTNGEQAFDRNTVLAQNSFEVLVLKRYPGFEAAYFPIDLRS